MTTHYMIIFILAVCILGSIFFWHGISKNSARWVNIGLGTLISILLFSFYALYVTVSEQTSNDKVTPTALDVYRGKTTLEITYRDTVAVDSAVVFK